MIPFDAKAKVVANQAKKKLGCNTLSDHIVLLKAFQGWQVAKNSGSERRFCSQYFINPAAMEMIHGIRTQLLGQLRASGFVRARGSGDIRDLNINSDNWPVVKAALSAGCYPNFVRIDRERNQLISKNERKIRFHPSSLLSLDPTSGNRGNPKKLLEGFPSDWFVYEELAKIGVVSGAKCCTTIHPVSIGVFAGPSRLRQSASEASGNSCEGVLDREDASEEDDDREDDDDIYTLKIDDWISFRVRSPTSILIAQIRQKWHSLFLRRMTNPSKPASASDEDLVRVLADILMAEDQAIGLEQPAGVGQRPVPMNTEYCPPFSSAVINSPIQRAPNFRGQRPPKQSPRQSGSAVGVMNGGFPSAGINGGPASRDNQSGHGSGSSGYYRYF